jgi:hypothetical protein
MRARAVKVYVAEMFDPKTQSWVPCPECTVRHGNRSYLLEHWKGTYPDYQFRTAQYVRLEK